MFPFFVVVGLLGVTGQRAGGGRGKIDYGCQESWKKAEDWLEPVLDYTHPFPPISYHNCILFLSLQLSSQ
jgi:hypothetical protein